MTAANQTATNQTATVHSGAGEPEDPQSACASGATDPELTTRRADAARTRGDHAAALAGFTAAAGLRPGNDDLQLKIAETLCDLNRFDEAAACCRRILDASPQNAEACVLLGSLAQRRGDYKAALESFEAAAVIKPSSMSNQLDIASSLKKLGRYEEAAERCRHILSRKPAHVRARQMLEKLTSGGATRSSAIKFHSEIRNIRTLRKEGELGPAEAACRQILEAVPDHPGASIELALILRRRDRPDAALPQLEIALRSYPADLKLALQLAETLRAALRYDDARTKYQTVLEREPENIAALIGLAKVARSVSQWGEMLHHLRTVAALKPDDACILLDIATVQFEMLLPEEAEATLQRAERLAGVAPEERYVARKFEYFCVTTQWERAEQCLARWPAHRDVPQGAITDVLRFYAERDRWHDVVDFFRERVIEGSWSGAPRNAEMLLSALAGGAHYTGRYTEALEMLDRWSGRDIAAAVQDLREQMAEEMSLLDTLGLLDRTQPGPVHDNVTNPVRAERRAVLNRAFRRGTGAAQEESTPDAHSVYYCTDTKYLLGAAVSLFSLLRHNPREARSCTFIVYCPPELANFASTLFGEIGAFMRTRIDLRSSSDLLGEGIAFRTKWGSFTLGRGLSIAAYYRIFAALQLLRDNGRGRALYIDSDTCIGPGLGALLAFDLKGRAAGVRREEPLRGVLRASARLGIAPDEYFNSGVLLFDLSHPGLEAALRASVEVAIHKQHLLTMVDQCALNLGFEKQAASLPAEFNFFVRDDDQIKFPAQAPVVTHFTAHPKPWDISYQSRHCLRWFEEFEALGAALTPELMKELYACSFPQRHGGWQGTKPDVGRSGVPE